MRYSIQHGNITTTASRGQGGSRFEPQPKGYGMSQNHHFECPQATFDSTAAWTMPHHRIQFHVSYVTLLQRLVTLVYVTNGQFYVTNVKNQVT